jgi:hypothetical protein
VTLATDISDTGAVAAQNGQLATAMAQIEAAASTAVEEETT